MTPPRWLDEHGSAPYFDLERAAWIPCVTWWDAETGELHRREGPDGFATPGRRGA